MPYALDLVGSRIVVREISSSIVIADTKILEYSKHTQIAEISVNIWDSQLYERVSVLVFQKSRVYEYLGTVRKSIKPNLVEIALYKGKEKEDRECRRYDLNTEGVVNSIKYLEQVICLRKSIEVQITNISASGVLIKALPNCFYKGTIIQLSMLMGKNETKVECCVVRVKDLDPKNTEYGCRFIYVERL